MLPNIFKKPEVLDKEKHKDIRLGTYQNYNFTKDAYLVPLGINEVAVAMKSLIVVFIKESSGEISPAAVLGGENNSNFLVDENGKWKENCYIPAALRCYPFGIGSDGTNKFFTIDSESELLNDLDGNKIFNSDMTYTDQGKHVFDFITEVYSKIEDAKKMSNLIETYKILKPAKMELTQGEKKDTLENGIYIIDEVAFTKLESRKIKQLATKGLLPLIYAHLFSLNNRY